MLKISLINLLKRLVLFVFQMNYSCCKLIKIKVENFHLLNTQKSTKENLIMQRSKFIKNKNYCCNKIKSKMKIKLITVKNANFMFSWTKLKPQNRETSIIRQFCSQVSGSLFHLQTKLISNRKLIHSFVISRMVKKLTLFLLGSTRIENWRKKRGNCFMRISNELMKKKIYIHDYGHTKKESMRNVKKMNCVLFFHPSKKNILQ